ncbi:MAG: GNAT family N-acetyltransferase [Ignisphaera sp.]|uniref:GNAT family N-acetyltransferase n=1 Tax=Ignisphaera aggregans TaxID=334771 RepID=A0A7C4JJP1_9CREN
MDSSDSEDDSSDHHTNLIIRKARLNDVNEIVEIYNSSIEFLDKESKEWIESIIKRRSRRVRIYVGTQDNKVVGFIIVYKKRNKAYIDSFAVDPMHRGRGIGQYLLKHVEEILVAEDVEKIYLSVKNHNNKALGIYIRNGYKISNVVLILEATSKDIDVTDTNMANNMVKIESVRRSAFPKAKLLDTSIWSNFTWDADEYVYRVCREEATAIIAYRGRKLLGVARVFTEQNKIFVERMALSFYRPTESLKVVVNAIKTKLSLQPNTVITIPVDSSKSSLLRTLISMGFKVVDSEYVLHKDLINHQVKQTV